MKWPTIIAGVAIIGLCTLSYLQSRSLREAGAIYSRAVLHAALKDLREIGELRNSPNNIRPFIFTNSFPIRGSNYQCAVAYEDPKFYGAGFLAVTTNGVFIYLDKKHGPKLIPSEGGF